VSMYQLGGVQLPLPFIYISTYPNTLLLGAIYIP
jgi:hypothetical protein